MSDTTTATDPDSRPARFLWLFPGLRPKVAMTVREERIFLLVGVAMLFAGFDQNIYGFAIPQIQASLNIAEDQIAPTVTYFRFAVFVAMLFSLSADIVGRRRLLLITIFGQAAFTLATAFTQNYAQFVTVQILTRIFGYAEEMLCIVVIVEEVAAGVRGWATGTLAAMNYTGAGLASLLFAAVNFLPGHWRALYVIGGLSLLFVAILRRGLPETRRFQRRHDEVERVHARIGGGFDMMRRLLHEYPGRIRLILVIVAAWGFAVGPATVLANMYLQKVLGFAPHETTALVVPGGLLALVANVLVGRLSDRVGRKRVVIAMMILCGAGYAGFYSGMQGWQIAPLWVVSYFAYFTADALIGGFALEIVPTAYRATVGGMRYAAEMFFGGIALYLEGSGYDYFGAHGPAISVALLLIPIAAIGVTFLPEPAGRVLEDISHA